MKTATYGPAFNEALDGKRLRGQIAVLYQLMRDAQWRTLPQISALTGIPEASASSDLRHLRKPQHGSYRVEKRRKDDGFGATWEYRLLDPLSVGPEGQLSLLEVM